MEGRVDVDDDDDDGGGGGEPVASEAVNGVDVEA